MKIDLTLHAALRGVGPRIAGLREVGRRGIRQRGAGPGVDRPGVDRRRVDRSPADILPAEVLRGARAPVAAAGRAAAAWPARRAAARVAAARWWGDRVPRERWLLAVLAVIVVVAAVARLVWTPLVAVREGAQAEIARDDRIAAELRVAGPEVARIAAARRGSLATIVTDRAARAGLTVARLEPQGADVTVGLDGVGFDPLIDWLAALDRDAGIVVTDLKVDRRPDPGRVTAQVTLTER